MMAKSTPTRPMMSNSTPNDIWWQHVPQQTNDDKIYPQKTYGSKIYRKNTNDSKSYPNNTYDGKIYSKRPLMAKIYPTSPMMKNSTPKNLWWHNLPSWQNLPQTTYDFKIYRKGPMLAKSYTHKKIDEATIVTNVQLVSSRPLWGPMCYRRAHVKQPTAAGKQNPVALAKFRRKCPKR